MNRKYTMCIPGPLIGPRSITRLTELEVAGQLEWRGIDLRMRPLTNIRIRPGELNDGSH